jgi:hypothetical protein
MEEKTLLRILGKAIISNVTTRCYFAMEKADKTYQNYQHTVLLCNVHLRNRH